MDTKIHFCSKKQHFFTNFLTNVRKLVTNGKKFNVRGSGFEVPVGTRLHLVPVIPTGLSCHHIFGRGATSSELHFVPTILTGLSCHHIFGRGVTSSELFTVGTRLHLRSRYPDRMILSSYILTRCNLIRTVHHIFGRGVTSSELHLVPAIPTGSSCHHIFGRGATSSERRTGCNLNRNSTCRHITIVVRPHPDGSRLFSSLLWPSSYHTF